MTSYIVDSSVWISYFEGSDACRPIIEENKLQTPAIVVAEVAKILGKKGDIELLEHALGFILKNSIILRLEFEQAVRGGKAVLEQKLAFVDALVYSYASEEKELATRDADFLGKPFVKFVE